MTLTDRRDSTTIHILRFSFNDDPSSLLSSTVSSEPLLEQRLLTLSSTLFATATVRTLFPNLPQCFPQRSSLLLFNVSATGHICRVLANPGTGPLRFGHSVFRVDPLGISQLFSVLRSSVSVYSNTPQIHIYTR